MKFDKRLFVSSTLASMLILGACGSNVNADNAGDTSDENATENNGEETNDNGSSTVIEAIGDDNVQEAVDIANENFNGLVEGISYETDDGQSYYEVNLESESEDYEIELDAEDLSVISEETEDESNNEKSYDKLSDAHKEEIISLEEAQDSALQEVDGEVTGWQYDVDDLKYEFEINGDNQADDEDDDDEDDDNQSEVEIDAQSGEVVETDS